MKKRGERRHGDGSTADFALQQVSFVPAGQTTFFGITSDLLISTMHLGLANGVVTQAGSFGHDNLTIAAVPEPGTLALLAAGLLGLGFARRRTA